MMFTLDYYCYCNSQSLLSRLKRDELRVQLAIHSYGAEPAVDLSF